MVAELVALGVCFLAVICELLHWKRVRVAAPLLFGPTRRPMAWVWLAPIAKVLALGAMAWGMTALYFEEPKTHKMGEIEEGKHKHVILILDVSPSMLLEDSGKELNISRRNRAREVLDSFFARIPIEKYRMSVVAVYTDAKTVVEDTKDMEVVYNILELPMRFAFFNGETKLFEGLSAAAELAKPWNPDSTTVVLVSDGDTVPSKGMPKMPAAVKNVLVVGVGDPRTGKFIAGRQSRQDSRTLRQIATRLGGTYHDGNQRQLSTDTINMLTASGEGAMLDKLTRREYALIALSVGAFLLAFLPIALFYIGTNWRPGVQLTEAERTAAESRDVARGSETPAAAVATGQGSTT